MDDEFETEEWVELRPTKVDFRITLPFIAIGFLRGLVDATSEALGEIQVALGMHGNYRTARQEMFAEAGRELEDLIRRVESDEDL